MEREIRNHTQSIETINKKPDTSGFFRLFYFLILTSFVVVSCKSKGDWREKYKNENPKENNKYKSSTYRTDKPETIHDLSLLLDTSSSNLKNKALYQLILDWYGTPYAFGNNTKKGIDCSGFTQIIYKEIYKKDLPRRSSDMSELIERKYSKDLKEGDLVFFSFGNSKEINHVGIYLSNNKFVHASTKKGVIVSDLTEPWYGDYLVKCGPIK